MKTNKTKVENIKKVKAVAKKTVIKKTVKKPVIIPVRNLGSKIVVTKKISQKKTVAKKTVVKKSNKKPLVVATDHNSFWMNNGQILNTLVTLRDALKLMDIAVYRYHTANGRHDFANWVEDVLLDIDCANSLRKSKTPSAACTTVTKHLTFYSI